MIKKELIKIKLLSEINESDLLNFYTAAYPLRYKVMYKHWKWIYRTSLFGFEPITINYDNKLAGHAGVISTNINYKNNILKGIWFVDFIILPEYRNKGLGEILTEKWMKISPYQLTFCNDRSLKIFKKFGWVENKKYYKTCNPINPLKWIPLIKSMDSKILNRINFFKFFKKINSLNKIDPFKLINNSKLLIEAFQSNNINNNYNEASILRDENWINWRLLQSPFLDKYFFFLKDRSFIVVSIYNYQNKKRLNIIYSKCENSTYEILLNKLIIKWSVENNIDVIWLNTIEIELKEYIKKFYPYRYGINFACNADEINIKKSTLKNITNIQAVDSDNDIIFLNNGNTK